MPKSRRIVFTNERGQELAGRLELPEEQPQAYAVFAHCFTCSKDSIAASRIARALASHGIAVLRFDFTGLGGSDGDFANTNFSSNVDDLISAADYLRESAAAPQLLIGHSLGGAAVLAAAHRIEEAQAVVTIAAPSDVGHVIRQFRDQTDVIEQQGEATLELGGRSFTIRRQFLEDARERNLIERVGALRKALVIFHSPQDETVSVEHARHLYDAARHPKSFISLDGANHLLSRAEDAEYVATMVAAWCRRYIVFPDTPSQDHTVQVEEGSVLVKSREARFTQDIYTRDHHLVGDEPHAMGGDNQGPSPYDYILAALGTCTAMTMRMYADHKGIPLQGVEVLLQHCKVHARDCGESETSGKQHKIDHIDRELRIRGDLTQDQVDGLVRIADKCPVHNSLQSRVDIETRLMEED